MEKSKLMDSLVSCVALGLSAFAIQSCGSSTSTTDGCSADTRFGGTDVECGKTPASLSVTPNGGTTPVTAYDFGRKSQLASYEVSLALKNSGQTKAKDIAITGATYPTTFKGGAFPGTGGTCSTTLDPDSTCVLVLTFNPDQMAPYSEAGFSVNLTIAYNDGANSQSINFPISATGDYCKMSDTSVSQTSESGSLGYTGENTVGYTNSFTVSTDQKISKASFKFYKFTTNSTVASVTYSIRADCSGSPCATELVSKTFVPTGLSTTAAHYGVTFDTPLQIKKDTTYWLVARMNGMSEYVILLTTSAASTSGSYGVTTNAGASWEIVAGNAFVFSLESCK